VAKAAEGLAPGGTPDRKDDVVPVTVGEPQPSTGPGTGTDTDRKDDFDVAAFTRVTVAPNGSIAAAGTYFDPGDEKNAPRNLVVNRLVHVEGLTPNLTDRVNSGHDAMHFITGFGINPKGADRIPGGQAFGATALELGGVMTPEDQQRNLNGILIENIVDGAKEAMFDQLSNREILAALPAEPRELRETAGRILFDLKKRTGYAIIQDGIVEGTDFHRQARQLAPESDPGAGLGRMEESPAVPDAERYVPKMDNVKFHHDNFNRLFEDNPKVLNDLKANLVKYLEYAARAEMAYAETGRAPSVPPLELTLPPDSTEALMRTAIKGLDQLDAAYPGADGIDELRNFYDSVLETGGDGSPQISQAPAGPALA
jgi:hypothetical protein